MALPFPFAGLAAGSLALFTKGSLLIVDHFALAFCRENTVSAIPEMLKKICNGDGNLPFETHILQGINLLLLGTGCLLLAIDLIDLFVCRLYLPDAMRAGSFHALKSRFANFIILAMAISFLEAFATTPAMQGGKNISVAFFSSPMLISAMSIAIITLALIAFSRWGGERSS